MKEYEKFSCSNCWEKYELFWKTNTKKIEGKITKEKNFCRRCKNVREDQNNDQEWNEGKKKIKKTFQLDILDEIFNYWIL